MDTSGASQQYKDKVIAALQDTSTLVSLGIFIIFLIIAGFLIFTNQKKISVTDIDNVDNATQQQQEQQATYTVKASESLWDIATERYGSGYNWIDIAQANNMTNADQITEGQVLRMPNVDPRLPEVDALVQAEMDAPQTTQAAPRASTYTVKEGDSLWTIAQQVYGDGYAWTQIANANNLMAPDYIHVGTVLNMPNI